MAFKFFEQCIYYMSLIHQLPQELGDELCLFVKRNENELNLIKELNFKKKMEYWKKLFNIIQKYEFEIFFRELELIIRFCLLISSDTKYMPFFDVVKVPDNLIKEKFKIINLLEFEKVKFSLRLDQIRLERLYNIKYYND